ncbi:helix-turn-helix domain-containing protein [Streptomyces sp. NPDC001889]
MRALREAQNLGLRGLETKTGLTRGYLSRLERGEVRRPAPEKIRRIAEALRVPTAAIDPPEETQ